MDIPFKPRAQILLQLGEQLIKNENIAILELVKNSYDADAKVAKVYLHEEDNPEKGYIEIIDDGDGMNLDIVANVWMEPGNNHKKALVEGNRRSPLGRLPIGEKGIGRFGVHKLGKTIQLITRQLNSKEVVVEIDWTNFESAEYLDDVCIHIEEREPQFFVGEEKGTYIRIANLSKAWTRGMVRSLYRAINALNSPFESDKSFKAKLYTDNKQWLEGMIRFEKIKDYALFECTATMKGNAITSFNYSFNPYELMKGNGLDNREVSYDNPITMKKQVRINGVNSTQEIDLSKYDIGEVRVLFYVFDRESSIINRFVPDKKNLTEYLDENGGVYVLRDGIRVLDYGEPGNDWLGLDIKRVNAPTQQISNNLILGAIYLDRATSGALKEKSNREGFIEDEAYYCFKDAVECVLEKLTINRNFDKEKMRNILSTGVKEPVEKRISEIRTIIANSQIEGSVKRKLDSTLKRVEDELETLKQRYIRTANAGMSYGIVIHEIEKIIGELKIAAQESGTSEKIRSLSIHLSKLVDSYAELLRNKRKSENNLKDVIKQALFSIEYRLSAHEITVENTSGSYEGNSCIDCAPNMIVGAIINLIDNSIFWTTDAGVEKRKLYISLTDEIDGYISIVVADNGFGYQLSGEDAIKPLVSLKPNGMGLGLSIVNEIMLSQNGKVIFPSKGDVSVPQAYENGAVTLLSFKKERL